MATHLPDSASEIVEIRTRLADQARAQAIATTLVEERLAACAHVRGPLHSVYRWQGNIELTDEYEVDAVTTRTALDALIARLLELHPYDLPAVLVTPAWTTDPYGDWVRTNTAKAQ